MEMKIEQTKCTDNKFKTLVDYLDKGKINSKILKEILDDVMENASDIDEILKLHDVKEMDESELLEIIDSVINDNPQSVNDYKNGNERAIKYLMGQIMKETKGNANPQLVNEKLIEKLQK